MNSMTDLVTNNIGYTWHLWYPFSETSGFQLEGWEKPLFSTRAILKKIRLQFPHQEFRSRVSRSQYSAGVKYIEYRYRSD